MLDVKETTGTTSPAGFAVDVGNGSMNSRVSSEWFARPSDQKFLDLNSLREFTETSRRESRSKIISSKDLHVSFRGDLSSKDLRVDVDGVGEMESSHWSFGQLCTAAGSPAGYLRELPSPLAAANLQHGIEAKMRSEHNLYHRENGDGTFELRALTSPTYGRIFDADLVGAIQKFAGNGTGDTRWKVPGVLDWSTRYYNPDVPVTESTTTLFASDRDVFIFLVDDRNPIELGQTKDGQPDNLFRGFYAWNSEVGSKMIGLACFYLRAVCANRCLWGVEQFQEISFKHTRNAPDRFAKTIEPALRSFADSSTSRVIAGVESAKTTKCARNDDDAIAFLRRQRFSQTEARQIARLSIDEEGVKPRTAWDMVQAITAFARKEGRQDQRINIEKRAGHILDEVA